MQTGKLSDIDLKAYVTDIPLGPPKPNASSYAGQVILRGF